LFRPIGVRRQGPGEHSIKFCGWISSLFLSLVFVIPTQDRDDKKHPPTSSYSLTYLPDQLSRLVVPIDMYGLAALELTGNNQAGNWPAKLVTNNAGQRASTVLWGEALQRQLPTGFVLYR
jgi:hypothetical protein